MPEPDKSLLKHRTMPASPSTRQTSPEQEDPQLPVVGIGASAGGLQAFIHLLEAVPEHAGMAFVLIQHLSPNHESMMAKLLGESTHMTVRQIDQDMPIERDCVYVTAPGLDVTLSGNMLVVADRPAHTPERLPFDTFLTSLALERGGRAMCVVLSGMGHDGSKGVKAVKHAGGFVIAQDPGDAEADGMPESAIQTGDVDAVLTAALIPEALMNWNSLPAQTLRVHEKQADQVVPDWLGRILKILLERTGTDFSLYKPGTLVRRITRRMSMLSATILQGTDYIKILLDQPEECEALAADLMINVTRFFRDPEVFEFLEHNVLPELVRDHDAERPFRVWVAGCSSGEEAWSLAMLLREAIDADGRKIRLQILASDIDADAIATARTALYPSSIASDVSPQRLARFFTPDERGFRVRDDLRSQAVFTVQNLLSDPPFARLNLVSCRNVLIYLGPEAQAKVISHFEFSLVRNGILLLGASETGGDISGRFEIVSQPARVYRRIGRARPAETESRNASGDVGPITPRFPLDADSTPEVRYADVCRRVVAEHYTPASVLVTREGACLHFLGPVDDFLEVPEGSASLDILPMVPLSLRSALRGAIAEAGPENRFIQLPGLSTQLSGLPKIFSTDVRYAQDEFGDLILITFHQVREPEQTTGATLKTAIASDALRLAELSGLREEIAHVGRRLELAQQSERKTRREHVRLNEEYQATNEELLTSKEELQALNEELSVLNSQLQETLERQRTTSDDLTNVLNSTNVATVFLDLNLCIRFFTPATRTVFGVIATDIGRPISDLRPLARDQHLLADAHTVLQSAETIEREISTNHDIWFLRRILPYRTQAGEVEGIVITYINVLEQHRATEALKSAIRRAEQAIIAKNRFLASASHDLRQPLQTLSIIHSLLSRSAESDEAQLLVSRMEQSVRAMTGMLDTMLDINQIQAGIITYQIEDIPVAEILSNLFNEFSYHAHAKSLELRMVHSSVVVRTDRRLFEQMIRNLLSNAIRYTDSGRILIGCRHRNGRLGIEIWDTGIGIAQADLPKVFGEYHKINTEDRAESDGIGLGLSIVRRLADLLGHRIHARSWLGTGSMFSIEVERAKAKREPLALPKIIEAQPVATTSGPVSARILVVEDEPDLRQLTEMLLRQSGHKVDTAATLEEAAVLAAQPEAYPDLLIADYNLPNTRSGIELARLLKKKNASLPVIILTGDISATTRNLIAQDGLIQMNKPVSAEALESKIQSMLGRSEPAPQPPATGKAQVVIVDDDLYFCETLCLLLQSDGVRAVSFPSGEAFLAKLDTLVSPDEPICVLIDAYLGGMSGFDVLEAIQHTGSSIVPIMITGNGDVRMAVQAMKAGALDFIEKPIDVPGLRTAIDRAFASGPAVPPDQELKLEAAKRFEKLTPREREVLDRILAGQPNKNIAADLGISQRTVESHRASVMHKSGCRSLPELVRLAFTAF